MKEVLIGIIQGITEFLPVSSSGHMVLFQNLFGIKKPGIGLEIALHLGTLVAILIFFYKDIMKLFVKDKVTEHPIFLIFIGSIPAGIFGILFKEKIETYFETINYLPIFFTFNSLLLIATVFKRDKERVKVSLIDAIIIGMAQAIALFPGISRSGSTVSTALLLGISSTTAFSFSFLLSIPAILGATLLTLKELTALNLAEIVLPFFSSLITGLLSLFILRKIVKIKKLYFFGIYTLILALFIVLFLR